MNGQIVILILNNDAYNQSSFIKGYDHAIWLSNGIGV